MKGRSDGESGEWGGRGWGVGWVRVVSGVGEGGEERGVSFSWPSSPAVGVSSWCLSGGEEWAAILDRVSRDMVPQRTSL